MGKNLYVNTKINRTWRLKVSDIHELYIEERGNPQGIPVVYLHGGPGGSIGEDSARFFDPTYYRVILFDQRGCGKSTPFAELRENDMFALTHDVEKIRQFLNIESWHVFGGSFGSTLALTYAINYPERCKSLVLRGIFLGREDDIYWLSQAGASYYYPEQFKFYRDLIPPAKRHDLVRAYYEIFTGDDSTLQAIAAKRWSSWEYSVIFLESRLTDLPSEADQASPEDVALARLECHYFVNKMFWSLFAADAEQGAGAGDNQSASASEAGVAAMADDQYILNNCDKIKDIPTYIVHGRYDMDCRPSGAYTLHTQLPKSKLWFTHAGHSSSEIETREKLVQIMDELKLHADEA